MPGEVGVMVLLKRFALLVAVLLLLVVATPPGGADAVVMTGTAAQAATHTGSGQAGARA